MRQPTKDYLDKIKTHLDGISIQLIDELTKVINGDWGLKESKDLDKVSLLDIEIFTDGYRLGLYPMDKGLTQLGYKKLLQEYSNGLLSDEELNPDINLYDLDNEDDNKELDEFESAQKEIFVTWFTNCWNKTDNKKLKKPIYLKFHDTSTSLDLNANRWVKDEIKWK
ncbi:MAG: hypothetical protein ACOYXT_05585 [Bacteroidota bacterium]